MHLFEKSITKNQFFGASLSESHHEARIAAACFHDEIAPCFGACHCFMLWAFGSKGAAQYRELTCETEGVLARIRLLIAQRVDVLICNGIEEQARRLLESEGCVVVQGIAGPVVDALYGYLAGKIKPVSLEDVASQLQPHTADLTSWTAEMLEGLGWEVIPVNDPDRYPLDLMLQRICPVCANPVRIAVCCGAHAWQVDAELMEFRRLTVADFHARIYVHHALPGLLQRCNELDIELLEPSSFTAPGRDGQNTALPPLKGRIEGHPQLNINPVKN